MNIGVLTFHDALNQGAVLQAFALQKILEKMGHNVEFINYCPREEFSVHRYISKSPKIMYERCINQLNGFIYRRKKTFNKILNISSLKYSTNISLKQHPPIYDIYIVGSDQVWNFSRSIDSTYLLDFVPKDKPKLSYAASLGQCNISKEFYHQFISFLSSFRTVSVRESRGVYFLESLMDENHFFKVEQVLDPTLLLSRYEYDKISFSIEHNESYIASYILSIMESDHDKILKFIASKNKIKILNLRNPASCVHLSYARNIIVEPQRFLGYIKNAQFVVCSSFHAVVFSLIFHRPFIVLVSKELNDNGGNVRINSLLQMVGLQHRCICSFEIEKMNSLLTENIVWKDVDEILKGYALYSVNYLKENIY